MQTRSCYNSQVDLTSTTQVQGALVKLTHFQPYSCLRGSVDREKTFKHLRSQWLSRAGLSRGVFIYAVALHS